MFLPGAGFSATIAVNGKNRASVLNGGAKGIADYLGNAIGSPVEDRTGLTGIYDVHLEFVPDSLAECDGCGGGTRHGHIRCRSIATWAEVNAEKGASGNARHRPRGKGPDRKLAGFFFQFRPARV